jgi:hypothetical protein
MTWYLCTAESKVVQPLQDYVGKETGLRQHASGSDFLGNVIYSSATSKLYTCILETQLAVLTCVHWL